MERPQDSFGKRIWRLIYPSLTYTAVTMVVGVIASMVIIFGMIDEISALETFEEIELFVAQALEGYYAHLVEIQGAAALLTLPFLFIFLRRDRARREEMGIVTPAADRAPLWMLLVVLFGAITAYAGNGMISLSGLYEVSDEYDQIAEMIYQGNILMEIVCLGILAPTVEELIFRGLMYTQMTEYMKKKYAVIMAALLFGLYHGNFLQAVYAFALGLLMIYVYERFHTLLAPILFHIGANVFGILMSETTMFSFLYQTAGAMYISVILFSLLIIVVVWLIEKRVQQMQGAETEQV